MGDWGRIHRKAHQHPKVRAASLGALGLWTLCNSWSRDNRTAGFIPFTQEDVVAYPDLADELVAVGLWDREADGYRFHDWFDHNGDDNPKTAAAKMVHKIMPGHPSLVRTHMEGRVAELLLDGQDAKVVEDALKVWAGRPDAAPSILPLLVSDAIKQRERGDLKTILRQCWASGDVSPLRRFGFWFQEPEAPLEIRTWEQMSDFMLNEKRAWLNKIAEGLT